MPRTWGWLWFGLLCRLWLWLFCVRGGFVCPFRLFAFGVGYGLSSCVVVSFVRLLVRVWCWFWSFQGAAVSFVLIVSRLFWSFFVCGVSVSFVALYRASCWETQSEFGKMEFMRNVNISLAWKLNNFLINVINMLLKIISTFV